MESGKKVAPRDLYCGPGSKRARIEYRGDPRASQPLIDTPFPYACGNRRGSERKVDLIDPLRSIEPGDLDTIHFREYAPLLHSKCVCRLCSLSSEELEDTSSGLGEAQSDHFQPEVIGELSTAPLY